MNHAKRAVSLLLCLALALPLIPALTYPVRADAGEHWVSVWHESILQVTEKSQAAEVLSSIDKLCNLSFSFGDGKGTFRIQLTTNLGGKDFKIRLANYYGTAPLKINGVTVGLQGKAALSSLDTSSAVAAATQTGATSCTIAKGASQELYFSFPEPIPAGSSLIVSIYCTNVRKVRDFALTGGAAWFQTGDQRSAADLSMMGNAANLVSVNDGEGDYNLIPLLEEVDVLAAADAYSAVFIGDSTITNSIPDMLQDNLQRNGIYNVSVVSSAIKGNELLQDGAGEAQGPLEGAALTTRFQKDALNVAGVRKIFVKIGANDILHPMISELKDWYNGSSTRPGGYTPSAAQIIAGFENLIQQANAAGVELYFTDINPFLGYTRGGDISWTVESANAANGIREAVNDWLAANAGRYAGYIPFSQAIGADYTIGSVTYRNGKIADMYTQDAIHPSPAGMQLEADLIPLSFFGTSAALSLNQAAVTGLWVATNVPPTNGQWLIASNSGSKIQSIPGQQGTVYLLAPDPAYGDEISTDDLTGNRGGKNGNAYNELGSVASAIQRGTGAAPYIASTAELSSSVWIRYGYGTRIYWRSGISGRYLSFYYPSVVNGYVSEFDAGLRGSHPEHRGIDLSNWLPSTITNEWFTIANTAATNWSSDPWELSMHFGAATDTAGDKYLAWGDMLPSANPAYATPGYHFRAYNTSGDMKYTAGENGNGTITYLSSVAAVHTTLTAVSNAAAKYTNAAAGTVVPVGFLLSDDLLNAASTQSNSTPCNITPFTVDGNTNVQTLLYTGYTYGQNQTIRCISDQPDIAYFDGSCVRLGGASGTANLCWTFEWDELNGIHYSMTVYTTVTNTLDGVFTIVHSSDGKTETLPLSEHFDITSKVAQSYLYGGSFASDYETPAVFGSGNPTDFTPENGATYYIWEVPDTYLRPKSMSLWEHKTVDEVDVVGFYLMSVIDRLNYQSVGFDVTASNGASSSISDVGASGTGTVSATLGNTQVYESIHIVFKEGSNPPYKDVLPTDFDGNSSGYLTCFDVPKDYWMTKGDTITFIPYWVTLDGVKVTGTLERICRYEGQGSDSAANNLHKMIGKVADDIPVASTCTAVTAAPALAARLSLRAAYVADGSQYTDPAPVDPSPVDPVEPSDSTVAITVHDNGSVSSVTVKPGSVSLTYAGAAGMRFAGWFTDAACTVPADLTNVLSDMTVYAKYVSDSYLTVKYAERGWFRVTGISLVSAVDSRSYADTGFVINGETVSATSYSSRYGFYTAGYLFGSGVDRNAPLMSYDYSLPSMSDGDTISVTPYWVTLDGTTVYGTTRTLTYYRFGLVG